MRQNLLINTRTGEIKTVLQVSLEYSCLTRSYIRQMIDGRKPNKTEYEIFKRSQTMNQLTLYPTPKETAIARAAEAQEKRVNGWSDKGLELLRQYAPTVTDFITEDFREWAEKNGLEKPKEPRAYGALLVRGRKAGIIRATGNYRCMKSEQSHSCPKMVWTGK